MDNQQNNNAGNGIIGQLDDLTASLQKSIELVSKCKEESVALNVQLEHVLDVWTKSLVAIRKLHSDYGLVDRSNGPIDLPNAVSGTLGPIPLVEIEPAENAANCNAQLESMMGNMVVRLTPIKIPSDHTLDGEMNKENEGEVVESTAKGKRKAETSFTEQSPKFQRHTRSKTAVAAQGAPARIPLDSTPKTRKNINKPSRTQEGPARMQTRLLRRKSTFN